MSHKAISGQLGPSERDIRIYVRHKIEGHSLRRCGKEFGVAATTIMRLVRAVEPWVVRQLVAEHPDRMTQKLLIHARYERIWQEANRGWRRSLKDAETLKFKGVATADGEGVVTDTEKTTKGQAGDQAFLAQMNAAQKGIRELWGLDEETTAGKSPVGLQVNVNGDCRIVVVEDEHWYGNDAHNRVVSAQAASPPIAGLDVGSEVQGGGLRAPVGENGRGVNGSH